MIRFLSFSFVLLSVFFSDAQVTCNIDPNNNVQGISPTPDEIPCVIRTQYYEEVVQVLVPTTVAIATVDSFEVLTVKGYPSDMQYISNPSSKRLRGGERGCFVFYGTTNEPKGFYEISFTGRAWVKVGGQTQIFPLTEQQAKDAGFDLFIEVIEPGDACRQSTGILADKFKEETTLKAYFSENNAHLMVNLNTKSAFTGRVLLVNMMGETITSSDVSVVDTTTAMLNTEGVSKGIYSVVLQSGNKIMSKKILAN